MRVISNYNEVNIKDWEKFVSVHPNGNIFQTPEMYQLYQSERNFNPILIIIENEKKEILGLLLSGVQKEKGLLSLFSSRAIVIGGPLILDGNINIFDSILKSYSKIIGKKVIYSQFRNIWDTVKSKIIFENNNFIYEDHLDIIIDLSKGKFILWEEIKSTRKKQIKRAYNIGITTRMVHFLTNEEMEKCYNILKKVYQKALLPFPTLSFFKNAQEIFSKNNIYNVILDYYQNEIIGFRIVLCYKNLVYDWYAASDEDHYDKYPNDILPWELWCWAIDNGYERFDFGGAGKPNIPYGVRDYKLKFGGKLECFGRYEIINKPLLYNFAKFGFKILRKFKIFF